MFHINQDYYIYSTKKKTKKKDIFPIQIIIYFNIYFV